jgi:hypothetical protein
MLLQSHFIERPTSYWSSHVTMETSGKVTYKLGKVEPISLA